MKIIEKPGGRRRKQFPLGRLLLREKKVNEYARAMYPRGDRQQIIKKIWRRRITLLFILILLGFISWLYCYLSEPSESVLSDGKYLSRQAEDAMVEMQVTGTGEGKTWEKVITVNLKQRKFTNKEKGELDQKLKDYVDKTLPGDNPSLENVTKPLQFAEELPGTEMELEWSWDGDYIKESGGLISARIPAEGVDTDIMLKASWRNWKKTIYYTVHLMPPELSPEKQQIREIKTALKDTLNKTADQEMVKLPDTVGDTKLTYHVNEEEKDFIPFYLAVVILIFFPVAEREHQKKKLAGREEQLYLDYPGIVNKVMLLLGAGLTFRGAVERIAAEYERSRKEEGVIRYAYEELCIMTQEMRDGVSEVKAMERFGRKCRLIPYLRFSSVITQNLKKGAEGILDLLEQESLEALEQRKERVLRMGETAGTKLLFPMIVMLGLVMGIIMVPAFMTL